MKELPVLDPRLALLAHLVRPGSVVADIGTDHGYLVTWLVLQGICPNGIAGDINEQPLERCRQTVQQYGASEKIKLVLGNGLQKLSPHDADDIIIAGMGGDLIAQILAQADWRNTEKRYLLQPMTRADELRRYLCANGYEITAEHAARANRFCYTVMMVRYTGENRPCSELFAVAGKLPECPTAPARDYLRYQAAVAQKKITGLQRSHGKADTAVRYEHLRRAILESIREEF